MIKYEKFRFIYPPRPEYAVSPDRLLDYDTGEYLAQPKLNGDCLVIFTNGIVAHIFNRHKKEFTKAKDTARFVKLHRETIANDQSKNKWIALVGEYMSKGKLNEYGENFNDNFVIFDILVYDSMQLLGMTFSDRINLLDVLFGKDDKLLSAKGVRAHKFIYTTAVDKVFRVKTFRDCLDALWKDLVKIDMYEGLVIKKAGAQLENGITEKNNSAGMVKIRKETKNYLY